MQKYLSYCRPSLPLGLRLPVGPSRSIYFVFLTLFIVVVLGGCQVQHSVVLDSIELRQELFGSERSAIQERLRLCSQEVETFKALASVKLHRHIVTEQFKQSFVFERPDSLRVDTFASELNQLAAILLVRDGTLSFVDISQKTYYQEPATTKTIEQFLSLPMEAESLMLWLAGRVPLTALSAPSVEDNATYRIWRIGQPTQNSHEDKYVLEAQLSGATYRALVVGSDKNCGYQLDKAEIINPDNDLVFSTVYHWPSEQRTDLLDSIQVPNSLTSENHLTSLEISINFSKIRLNSPINHPKVFTLNIPAYFQSDINQAESPRR